jgi:hypothetical protein
MRYQTRRKSQRGGLKRQLGQRNLFHPTPLVKFTNTVEVHEREVNKNTRPLGNRFQTKTRGLYTGTPHKSDAEYQQLVSSLYGKISEEANTPEQMYSTIQNLIAQSNKTNKTRRLKKQLEHKLKRNFYGK